MTIADIFVDFEITDTDVSLDGHVTKKPPHISCTDWWAAWNGDDRFNEGYEEGRKEKSEVWSSRNVG